MRMWNDKRMHFWIRLTRVTDKAPGHAFFASTGTDAETTGRFCESIVRVGFATVYDGQKQQQVFDLYKDAVLNEAMEQGFSNVLVTQIGKREYGVQNGKVRLGIDAPPNVPVHRQEVYDAIQRERANDKTQD